MKIAIDKNIKEEINKIPDINYYNIHVVLDFENYLKVLSHRPIDSLPILITDNIDLVQYYRKKKYPIFSLDEIKSNPDIPYF